jgi:hypothetical protein
MLEPEFGPRIHGLRLARCKLLQQDFQDAVVLELRQRWDGCGDFRDPADWDSFVLGVAGRLGPELVGDLEQDQAFRKRFEWLLHDTRRELIKRGLMR